MKYNFVSNNFPALKIDMQQGESLLSQKGGMAWMTDGVRVETNMQGGLMKGLGRAFGGESMFMATYTCDAPSAMIVISSTFVGKILPYELNQGNSIICQKDAFLCSEKTVQLQSVFTKRIGAGLVGGEGFILQRMSGSGMAFMEIDGDVVEYDLAPGQILKVDSGHVAAFQESVAYEVETMKGFRNVLFGGEGLFIVRLRGPGKVWLQTMTVSGLAARVASMVPGGNR